METNQTNTSTSKNIAVWVVVILAVIAIIVVASTSGNKRNDMMGSQENTIRNDRMMNQSGSNESAQMRTELQSTDLDGTSDAI